MGRITLALLLACMVVGPVLVAQEEEHPQEPPQPEDGTQPADKMQVVEPVSLPWKSAPVRPVHSREFEEMVKFFRFNLNIKDISRIVAPAVMPFVGILPVRLRKDITEYGGKKGAAGVLILTVQDGSPAEKAGLKKGDVVTGLGGEAFKGKSAEALKKLSVAIGLSSAGDVLKLSILRDGKKFDKEIQAGLRETAEMPVPDHPEICFDSEQELSVLEEALRSRNIFDPFLKTASQIAGAANLTLNKTRVGDSQLINPFRLKEVTCCLRNPLKTVLLSQEVADRLRQYYNRDNQNLQALLRECASLLDCEPPTQEPCRDNGFMPSAIIESAAIAASRLEKAFEKLGPKGIERLTELTSRMFGQGDERLSNDEEAELLSLGAQVDYNGLASASLAVVDRLTPYNLGCMAARLGQLSPVEQHPGVSGEVLVYEKTKFGLVIVGGKGPNTYSAGAAVIVELGGDDLYLDGAAVATPQRPVSLIIDYGGDDFYLGRKAGPCAANCGVAVLLDFAGNDLYSGKAGCQGWAAAGVALLADFGGADTYRAEAACQGGALFGIGLLLDTQPPEPSEDKSKKCEGCDTYSADLYSQGFGCVKGIGVLLDAGGNDVYRAGCKHTDHRDRKRSTTSFSQGFGLGLRPWGGQRPQAGQPLERQQGKGTVSPKTRPTWEPRLWDGSPGADGGIGVLLDLGGHDFYIGDYFAQGASYWYALGVLFDAAGDDVYLAGRYSQGAGIHLSVGSLIDQGGDDRYSAYYGVSQGCGHDWSAGCLYDAAGNDSYSSGVLAQGVGNDVALGLLVDVRGNDVYRAKSRGQGAGNRFDRRNAASMGVLFDGAGEDIYIPQKDNNTIVSGTEHGVLIDK